MCLLLLPPAAAGKLRTRYVILLLVFNTVCYGNVRNFRGFRRFLINDNSSYLVLYTQCGIVFAAPGFRY